MAGGGKESSDSEDEPEDDVAGGGPGSGSNDRVGRGGTSRRGRDGKAAARGKRGSSDTHALPKLADIEASPALQRAVRQVQDVSRLLPGLALRHSIGLTLSTAGRSVILCDIVGSIAVEFAPVTSTASAADGSKASAAVPAAAAAASGGSCAGVLTLRVPLQARAIASSHLDAETAALVEEKAAATTAVSGGGGRRWRKAQ